MPRIDLPDAPIEIAPDDPMPLQIDKMKDNVSVLWQKVDELVGEDSPIYQNLQEIYNVDMTVGGGGGGGGVGPGTANRISMFTAPNAVGDSIITQAGMAGIDIGGWLSVSSYLLMGGNIRLNGNWLSNDGDNEGIQVDNAGNVVCSADITITGNNILDAGGAWIDSDGAGNTTLQGNLNVTLDLTVTGNNILDAGGAWIDSDGAGNTTLNGQLGIGIAPTQKLSIGSTDNSNYINIYHDNTNAQLVVDDGYFNFTTAEVNQFGRIDIQGNGTGSGEFRVYNPGNGNYLRVFQRVNKGEIHTEGGSAGAVTIQAPGHADVYMFEDSTSGETRQLFIYGFRAGDAKRSLEIGVGDDAADTASFDGVSNYLFDGNILCNSDLTVTGNNILDAGGAWLDSDGAGNTTAQGNLTTTGHLGVDIAAATDRTLYVSDTALSITTTYYGIYNEHTKTAGITTEADDLYGCLNTVEMNHNGSVIGNLVALAGLATLTDGTIGDGEEDLIGVYGSARIAGGTADNDMMGIQSVVIGTAGTVSNDVAGVYTEVDIDVGMTAVGGNVYGYYLDMDVDQDPVGSAYGLYMNCQTNVDYGIYQLGALYNYFGAVLHCPDGAVGAPAYSFFNDTDTGMYRIGADNLGLAVNGTLGLEIDANGNVIVANDLTVTERIMMPGRLEAGDGFLTDVAARAAPDSIAADFHIFVTPSDVDHDYFAFSDKLDGQTIMVTNDGSVTANVDADEGGGAGGFVVCINETLLAKWDVTDDSWYTVRG